MLYLIRFHDVPGKLHVRQEHMSRHLAFLAKHSASVRVAGSMRRESDDSPVGGAWIVEAESYDAVRSLFSEDPFWTAGLRESVEIHRLAKAFPGIERLV